MPVDRITEYAADVLAELCVFRAFRGGKLGVFAENVPSIDLDAFVKSVEKRAPSRVRVALLGTKQSMARSRGTIDVTSDPSIANKWRNDEVARRGTPGVFVVVGPTTKVNSLRTALLIITATDVRAAIVDRCRAALNTPERRAFLDAVERLSGDISTTALIQYAAALHSAASNGKAGVLDAEPELVRLLGLLPTPALLNSSGPAAAKRSVRKNLDLVRSLATLDKKKRETLAAMVGNEHPLASHAQAILRFHRSADLRDLADVTFEEVVEALRGNVLTKKADNKEQEHDGRPTKRERLDGDALALDLILNQDGSGLKVAAKRFQEAIEPDSEGALGSEEFSVGRRALVPRVKVGSTQATSLFGQLLSSEVWGGLIRTEEAVDFVAAQKLVASGDAMLEEFRPDHELHVRGTLRRAVERGIAEPSVLERWDGYATARATLLPGASALIDHPLLALAAGGPTPERAKALLEAYGLAIAAVKETARALEEQGSHPAAKRLIACCLALDVVFVKSGDEFTALAAPTHPFHLWRWVTFSEILDRNREELKVIGKEALEPLVTDPPASCPQLLLSPFAVEEGTDRDRPLVPIGAFAALPLFAEPTARQAGKFRSRELARIAARLLRLMPHAAFGFRVALVDPPSVAGALEDLIEMENPFDEDGMVPIHATVLRTRSAADATDEEDDAITQLARDLTDQGGSLTMAALPDNRRGLKEVAEYLERQPVHLAAVFDPGVSESISVSLANRPSLSPLIVPRAYKYDRFDDRLDLVVAGDAEPFATYHEIFCKSLGVPPTDFVGRKSGASQCKRQLEKVARTTVWLTVIDQAIEPTIRIEGAQRIEWRQESGRDLVTFTAHPETIEELVADAVRLAGLVPDEEMRKQVLNQMFELSGESVLRLARGKPGASIADPRKSKGTIGVLSAVKWYLDHHPGAVVISLDDPTSRQWVLGLGSDDRQGDLLAIRSGDQGVIVEVLEVKTHEDEVAGVRERAATLEGRAATQVDQTIATLRSILSASTMSPVLRARQDILRDQLYRAVASRPCKSEERGRHVTLLEALFSPAPHELAGLVVRVAIRPGEPRISPAAPAWTRSPGGNKVGLVDIVESGPPGKFRSLVAAMPRPLVNRRPELPEGLDGLGPNSGLRRNFGSETSIVPDPSGQPSPGKADASTPGEVRVLIGHSRGDREVYWEPHQPDNPLNNFGFLVTGDPGSGKTQIIKALIAAVCDLRLPVCIFDFKNDYSDSAFSQRHGLRVFDIDREGLPFNPMSLLGDDRGEAQPIRQIHELVGILRRIYKLGDQQSARLKGAMVSAYESHGIRPEARIPIASVMSVPSFASVKNLLEHDDKNEPLLNRLSPLFDLNLFPEGDAASTTFAQLIQDRVVLDLHSLPTDDVKSAMSEFIIVRLHSHVLKGEQPRKLRRMLVFDEAWRVKDSDRLQELAREGRAFGVGITIGTQFPGDIPENLAGNLATQLLLSNQNPDHRKAVVRALVGSNSGAEAQQVHKQLPHLQKHDGYLRNQQYAPYVMVKTLPYYLRK